MAIGNQASYSTTSVNSELAQVAVNFHNAADHAQDLFERINKLGTGGLQAIGFDAATATQILSLCGQMNEAARIWFGLQNLANPFNYDDASAAAR